MGWMSCIPAFAPNSQSQMQLHTLGWHCPAGAHLVMGETAKEQGMSVRASLDKKQGDVTGVDQETTGIRSIIALNCVHLFSSLCTPP